MLELNSELLTFIQSSPSIFHTILSVRSYLEDSGFVYLPEGEKWLLVPGCYYTTRNDSSLIAFIIPEETDSYHFQICASHSDSPTFKLKNAAELGGHDYLKLNVEPYGGMIDYTWLDRPLSIAGRVLVKCGSGIESRLVNVTDTTLMIPSLPIHFNRDVNKGYNFNNQTDMSPLCSAGKITAGELDNYLAEEIGISPEKILGRDLFLVNRQPGCIWGLKKEFVSAPKLDDLQAVFTSLKGFIENIEAPDETINVFCCFDNEEVGSRTKQGACSTFLSDVLHRINSGIGKDMDDYYAAISGSFMVSFDNAHAVHPNHPEKYDPENCCCMNKGIVIKENAAQHYTTDAFSRAVMTEICNRAGVPVQSFANRSDQAGGSTLGNLSSSQVSMNCVDIGLAQLAMHSAFETAGTMDTTYAVSAIAAFYRSSIVINGADSIHIN